MTNHPSPCTLPSRVSPWLMLGGPHHNHRTEYNFFGFKENIVISLTKRTIGPGGASEPDPYYVGSSHGWLAWVSSHPSCYIYLTNPVSSRQICLPSIFTLLENNSEDYFDYDDDSEDNRKVSFERRMIVSIVLSSSPDSDPNSRAVMIYNRTPKICSMAFCRPGRDEEEWTPLVDPYHSDSNWETPADLVYSSEDQWFYYLQEDYRVARLDLRDCSEPERDVMNKVHLTSKKWYSTEHEDGLIGTHVVVDPTSKNLLFVRRYVDDGNYQRTSYFRVFRLDDNDMRYFSDSLPGNCVMFVGRNHGFALKASDFPEFVPNSIYFTDYGIDRYSGSPWTWASENYDIGIFDYKTKLISPCCNYPLEKSTKIEPAPIWFTPNPC